MKGFLLYIFLIYSFQSFSTDLKRIDSVLVANGYRTNIDNLENDNYYQAWKMIGDRPVSIEIFGKDRVNQIQVSQTVCPSLDSLSEQEETKQKEAAKTRIIQELQLILYDRLIIEELEKLKIEKRWSDSKEYNSKWTIKNEQIELRYDFHNEHKCDIYFDGFYVNVSLRYL